MTSRAYEVLTDGEIAGCLANGADPDRVASIVAGVTGYDRPDEWPDESGWPDWCDDCQSSVCKHLPSDESEWSDDDDRDD